MKRSLVSMTAAIVLALSAFGQVEEPIVNARILPPAEAFRPGQAATLTLELAIRAPYHINSDQPTEPYLIGTAVHFKPRPGTSFGRVVFPPAEMRKLALAEDPLSIFEGTIKVTVEVSLAPDFRDGELEIEGTVEYQACDDVACFPPTDAPFSGTVRVQGGRPAQEAAPPPAAKNVETEARATPPARAPEQPPAGEELAAEVAANPAAAGDTPFAGKGLPVIFALVFLGGLALNLTPCIYPIIPITISYFGGQSEGRKGGVVLHAIFYVLGMAVTYSLLGVAAAFTGGLFGAALSYPPVLVAIAAVMIALALSMFDVYEFRMPAFLNRLAGGHRKGYLGTVLMGLTVGIVAAPCIGPFVLGLLTYVGNRGNVLLGFSLFFVLALGLGVPFLILGIFSGSLNKFPRSGAWMVWVRKIFGFILVAMAFYFLKPVIANTLAYHFALAMTMLAGGLYMGWMEPTRSAGKVFPAVRAAAGIAFLVLSVVFAVLGVEARFEEAAAGGPGIVRADIIAWEPYSEERLASALDEGRPIFIDAYADWCIPCKEMDKLTFSRPSVVAASRSFLMLKADLTFGTDEKVKAFSRTFGVRGVPTLIFLRPDGTEIEELRGTGFEPEEVFLEKMNRALSTGGDPGR